MHKNGITNVQHTETDAATHNSYGDGGGRVPTLMTLEV